MRLELKNTINPRFSLASMVSVVFLLFVFFMMTSSFVTPSGVEVIIPVTKGGKVAVQTVSVTITKRLSYFVNQKQVTKAGLEGELKSRLGNSGGAVVVHVHKSVPSEHLVYVAGIASSLEAKVVIATKPE